MIEELEDPSTSPVYSVPPDPDRPAVPAAVAAQYFQKSRFYLTELIKQGEIDGYGIQKDGKGRIRWFVYEDIIPSYESTGGDNYVLADTQKLISFLVEIRELSRRGQSARMQSHDLSIEAAYSLSEAVQAAISGKAPQINDLLMSAVSKQGASAQKQLEARRFELDAEAHLDQMLSRISATSGKSDDRFSNDEPVDD